MRMNLLKNRGQNDKELEVGTTSKIKLEEKASKDMVTEIPVPRGVQNFWRKKIIENKVASRIF